MALVTKCGKMAGMAVDKHPVWHLVFGVKGLEIFWLLRNTLVGIKLLLHCNIVLVFPVLTSWNLPVLTSYIPVWPHIHQLCHPEAGDQPDQGLTHLLYYCFPHFLRKSLKTAKLLKLQDLLKGKKDQMLTVRLRGGYPQPPVNFSLYWRLFLCSFSSNNS